MASLKSGVSTLILFFAVLVLDLLNDPLTLNTDTVFWVVTGLFFINISFNIISVLKKRVIRGRMLALFSVMLIVVVITGWNRLCFFQGYFEIPEGGEFRGEYTRSFSAPLSDAKRPALILSRESGDDNTRGVRFYIYGEGRQRTPLTLGWRGKRRYKNMTLKLAEKEFGVTFFFSLKRSEELPVETFSFNFPLNSSRTFEFALFGLDGKVKASFSPGNISFKREAPIPDNLEILLTYKNEKPLRLGVGDYIMINTRLLTLTAIKRWNGVVVDVKPASPMAIFDALKQVVLR